MKVAPSPTLSLPRHLTESLKGDGIFRLRILVRETPHRALAEINGVRVQAHFTEGLPPGDFIRITRDGSHGEMTRFRILPDGRSDIPGIPPQLLHKIPFPPGDTMTWPLSTSLVSLIMRRGNEDPGNNRALRFINRLLSRGIPMDTIRSLVRLLPGGEILALIHPGGRHPSDQDDLQDCITEMESLENSDDVSMLISLLSQRGPYYESAMDDEGHMVPLEIYRDRDFMAVSIALSGLGMIDIVAVAGEQSIRLFIITGSPDASDELGRSLPAFTSSIEGRIPPVTVTVMERRDFLDQVLEYKNINARGSGINIQV